MILLSVDTSSAVSSCAILGHEGETLASLTHDGGLQHSRTILPLIDRTLAHAGISASLVGGFCAVTGPGSFTGIRIGVSAVKGLAWSFGKPCYGVSSLLALARCADQAEGLLCPLIAAREDEFYAALYRFTGFAAEERAGGMVLKEAELGRLAKEGYAFCVQGAALPTGQLRLLEPKMPLAEGGAKMAILQGAISPHELKPNYLRQTQAERLKGEQK